MEGASGHAIKLPCEVGVAMRYWKKSIVFFLRCQCDLGDVLRWERAGG